MGLSGQTASCWSVLFHKASTVNQQIIALMKYWNKATWHTKESFTKKKTSPHKGFFPLVFQGEVLWKLVQEKRACPPPTTTHAWGVQCLKAIPFMCKPSGTRFKGIKYTGVKQTFKIFIRLILAMAEQKVTGRQANPMVPQHSHFCK